jgi:hypothetical protein
MMPVRRTAVLLALAAAAAGCHAPAETLVQPAPRPPRPGDAPIPLLGPPASLLGDPLETATELPAGLAVLLPRPPVLVVPGAPRAGGDALQLADLAMRRGDPRDAAVQYRALLADRRPEVATYVRWRLANAALAIGEEAEGERLLRELAGASTPTAWAALLRLAERIADRDGVEAALAALRVRAEDRADDLERWLIARGHGPGRVALLVARAERTVAKDERCACALAALTLDAEAIRAPSVRACHRELASGRLTRDDAPLAQALAAALVPDLQRKQLAEVEAEWAKLVGRANPVRENTSAWLDLAHSFLRIHRYDRTAPAGERASHDAVSALENAARIALTRDRIDDALVLAAGELADDAHPTHRRRAAAIRDALVHRLTHPRAAIAPVR